MKYVNQLEEAKQEEIKQIIATNLKVEGLDQEEIETALEDALCSKVSDLEEHINVKEMI